MRAIVLGGGVAGMSAAHELAERGFEVVVFEARAAAGGKARSFPFPGSATQGRSPLPGEHGFRFFPGFYRHLPDTMRRIPYGREQHRSGPGRARPLAHGGGNVFKNLVTATEVQIARADGRELLSPAHLPRNLRDLANPAGQVDRVLNGPTSDVWIDPWREHLEAMGVDFRTEHQVQAIHCRGGRVSGVTVVAGGRPSRHEADWYVAALPVEVMRLLASEQLVLADPRLARLHRLRTRWMNGIVYYLDRDVRAVHGHTVYIDSPWALTSISQPQFWQPQFQPERLGDGRARGILSVDVSDWEAIGSGIRKQAMYCSREEITREVWHQLKESLDDDATRELERVNVLASFLDPSIVHPNPTEAANLEPLLVNTVGSWRDRPDAETELDNLLLASDYVRTHTDLATMEGANEAARRAVNAILERSGSDAERCGVWRLREPELFAPARALDRVLFKLGRPPRQQLRMADGRVRAAPYLPLAEKWTGSWAPSALKIFGE